MARRLSLDSNAHGQWNVSPDAVWARILKIQTAVRWCLDQLKETGGGWDVGVDKPEDFVRSAPSLFLSYALISSLTTRPSTTPRSTTNTGLTTSIQQLGSPRLPSSESPLLFCGTIADSPHPFCTSAPLSASIQTAVPSKPAL